VSVRSESKDLALLKWKQDLDARCEKHMLENPELGAPSATVERPVGILPDKIRCFESIYAPGAWNVYSGDVRITTFTGAGARQKALDMVKDLTKVKD